MKDAMVVLDDLYRGRMVGSFAWESSSSGGSHARLFFDFRHGLTIFSFDSLLHSLGVQWSGQWWSQFLGRGFGWPSKKIRRVRPFLPFWPSSSTTSIRWANVGSLSQLVDWRINSSIMGSTQGLGVLACRWDWGSVKRSEDGSWRVFRRLDWFFSATLRFHLTLVFGSKGHYSMKHFMKKVVVEPLDWTGHVGLLCCRIAIFKQLQRF